MTSDSTPETVGPDRPDFRLLLDWLEGRLTREAAAAMSGRTNFDDETRTSIRWIEDFRRFARDNPVPAPPAIVKQRLMQSFERHHGRDRPEVFQRAQLMFDTRDDVVMAGVRGSSEPDVGYQLTFATESHGVLVDVLPTGPATVRVEGQVLGSADESKVWVASVKTSDQWVTNIHGDSNGSFSVADVPLDVSLMRLSNGETTIDVASPLGESGG